MKLIIASIALVALVFATTLDSVESASTQNLRRVQTCNDSPLQFEIEYYMSGTRKRTLRDLGYDEDEDEDSEDEDSEDEDEDSEDEDEDENEDEDSEDEDEDEDEDEEEELEVEVIEGCDWVAQNATERCAYRGVSKSCPSTCGTCATCEDSRLEFMINGRSKRCWWVRKKKAQRCLIAGVADTCRKTCGTC